MPMLIPDFSPVMTYSSPSRAARQTRLAASEPTLGSVRAMATTVSPLMMPGSHRFFTSSAPFLPMISPASPASCSAYVHEKSPRAISSIAMPVVKRSASWPPYSTGARRPSRPSSPICRHALDGNSPLLSQCCERTASSFRAKPRSVRISSSCSAVNAKSTKVFRSAATEAHELAGVLQAVQAQRRLLEPVHALRRQNSRGILAELLDDRRRGQRSAQSAPAVGLARFEQPAVAQPDPDPAREAVGKRRGRIEGVRDASGQREPPRITWKCGASRTNVLQVGTGNAGGSYTNNFSTISPQLKLLV